MRIDLDGNARPFGKGWDIGCYEYVGTSPAAARVVPFASPSNPEGMVESKATLLHRDQLDWFFATLGQEAFV